MDTLRRWWWTLPAGLLLVLALLGAWATWQLQRPLALSDSQTLLIEPGSSFKQALAQAPMSDGQKKLIDAYAHFSDKASKIKAGEYLLLPSMSALDWLDLLIAGKSRLREIRINEGETLKKALERINNHPDLSHGAPITSSQLKAAWGKEPEGWLFPDTYHFSKGMKARALVDIAHQLMEKKLNEAWQDRAEGLPYKNAKEALIMASIVEKETGQADERPLIAGVFVQRLRLKMRLQTDPTVIYGMGDNFNGNIRKSDLEQDTPWNTYTRSGLPPTAIAIPSFAAIEAALHPEEDGSLYFVAKGGGRHQFSETLEQHNAAVQKYILGR
jgi:UPF0755 protein